MAMPTITMICCPFGRDPGRAPAIAALRSPAIRGDLRRRRRERGHRRRRAVVDVGRPHVERHRETLNARPASRNTEPDHELRPMPPSLCGLRDAVQSHRAGQPVDQRGAIEQQPGRQRAEHENISARPRSARVVAMERGEHVERETHQLETEI